MKIARTSKRNGCRVCGGHDSKCGWLPDSDIHFCMNINDAISAPSGWKYVGETRDGTWGMFVQDTGKQYTEEEIAAYKQRKIEEELKRRLHHTQSLSETSRHNELTKLVNQLPLNECHCEDLKRRNLSDELIKRGNFRSVDKFQKFDFEISHNLPGVSISGKSLTNRVTGYMVPIWNEHGQMIGYQIRNDDTNSGAKYIWATSNASARRIKGVSSHLQNGELPLTFCVSDKLISKVNNTLNLSKNTNGSVEPFEFDTLTDMLPFPPSVSPLAGSPPIYMDSHRDNWESVKPRINIAEGFLKTFTIAHLRELLVIGASGGNFVGSIETFKRYLDAASLMLGGTKEVVLWADAGAIANKHVMRQYRKTHSVLSRWGYKLQIAWWGQIDKNCLDGDEYLGDYDLISWYEFESMSRNPDTFWDSIEQEFAHVKRSLRRKPIRIPDKQLPGKIRETTLTYIPGNLPTYGEYVDMGCPVIKYKNNERSTLWKEAAAKGWTHVLDKSAPGLGKSHTVGSLTADYIGFKQIMYFAADHRNPTTITIEKNFVDVYPRHNKLEKDPTRKTQLDNDFIIWGNGSSDNERITPNCARVDLFAIARKKNYDLESSDKHICVGCSLYSACQSGSGDYFGYLSQRAEALRQPEIRLHPDSAPLPKNYEYETVFSVWDETSQLLRSKKTINVTETDVHKTLGPLIDAYNQTKHSFDYSTEVLYTYKMTHVLLGLFEMPSSELGRYGLNDSDIRSRLGVAPSDMWVDIFSLQDKLPNLNFLIQKSEIDTRKLSQTEKRSTNKFNKLLGINNDEEAALKLESLPLNWEASFLQVWSGMVPGHFAFNNGVLTIHMLDRRHQDIAHAAAFNLYLDGTMPVENLSLKLGVPREHILVLETETPDYSNLEIVHIPDMGVLGRDRRESQQSRVDILRDAIVKIEQEKLLRHLNNTDNHSNKIEITPVVKVGVIERKAFARSGDGYHFRDGRGVNRFSDVSALIGIGAPYANIGELKAEYSVLMKWQYTVKPLHEYSEQEYIDGLTVAEILQEIGRLRSHLRGNELLTYYFVGEFDLAPVLESLPGVKYSVREAVEISPYAASGEQRTMLMVLNAIGNLIRRGILSPTQKEVVAELESHSPITCCQGRVSQLMKCLGGWLGAIKAVSNVLAAFKNDKPCTENSFDDEEWIVLVYLPLIAQTAITDPVEAVRELVGIAVAHGWDSTLR